MPKGVDHLRLTQQLGEALSLLGRETSILLVRLEVLQIDIIVGHVEVAAHDRRLLRVEILVNITGIKRFVMQQGWIHGIRCILARTGSSFGQRRQSMVSTRV